MLKCSNVSRYICVVNTDIYVFSVLIHKSVYMCSQYCYICVLSLSTVPVPLPTQYWLIARLLSIEGRRAYTLLKLHTTNTCFPRLRGVCVKNLLTNETGEEVLRY